MTDRLFPCLTVCNNKRLKKYICGKPLLVSSQAKLDNPAIRLPGLCLGEIQRPTKHVYKMFRETLFVIHKHYLYKVECINFSIFIYYTEIFFKKKEPAIDNNMEVSKSTMLGERKQTQKTMDYILPSVSKTGKVTFSVKSEQDTGCIAEY
jgi:hypothetical protein